MIRRLNISISPDLVKRSRRLENVSWVCQRAIEAACRAIETGIPQTITFELVECVQKELIVHKNGD